MQSSAGQLLFFPLTLAGWAYWRLYFLPAVVMYSIAVEAKSLIFELPCEVGECHLSLYPWASARERLPFLLLLGALLYLHTVWFVLLVKKGVRELGGGKKEKLEKKDH
jgi:hypothetical protein